MNTVDPKTMSRKELNAYAVSIGLAKAVVDACANFGELLELVNETLNVQANVDPGLNVDQENLEDTEETTEEDESAKTDEEEGQEEENEDESAAIAGEITDEIAGAQNDDETEDEEDEETPKPKSKGKGNVEYVMTRNVKHLGTVYRVGTECPKNAVRMFVKNGYAVAK
jgi:cobalamin biosynthesis protein CobT